MSKVQGTVFKIYTKEFAASKGKPAATLYSIKLDGDKLYYRCNKTNPGNIEGKEVSFETSKETDKDAQVDMDTLKVVEAKKAAVTGGAPANAREGSIQYQSARNAAIDLVVAIIAADVAGKPIVKLPVKEAGRLDTVNALIDQYTTQFFQDVETFGAVARANGTDGEGEDEQKDVTDEDNE